MTDRELILDLARALLLTRDYLQYSLGSPGWDGEDPYPVMDAALAKAHAALTEQVS